MVNHKQVLRLLLASFHDYRWDLIAGSALTMTDEPKKLWNSHASVKIQGKRGNHSFSFDRCLYGYTMDCRVISFRIKTKSGYIPLRTINGRYFLRLLTDAEKEEYLETQGLNDKGIVIQSENGLLKHKPRQWSPRHSELYG